MFARLFFPEWQGYADDQRVSLGADLLRDALWRDADVLSIEIPMTEELRTESGVRGCCALARNVRAARDALEDVRAERVFMLGGTCASELAPVAYLNERFEGDLAVLWFDAHGDLNTPESSPSGRFHGMVLRALLGEGAPDLVRLVARPLVPGQVTLVGARDLDPPERAYVAERGIPVVNLGRGSFTDSVLEAAGRSGARNVYVHIDLDFFDPAELPDVLIPTPGGGSVAMLEATLRALRDPFRVAGLSIVEFVPVRGPSVDKVRTLVEASGVTSE